MGTTPELDPTAPYDFKRRQHAPGIARTVLVIACGAIAREIIAVLEQNNLRNIDVTCLPAIWHNHPERIPEGVRTKIREARGRYDHVYVAYGDCGTGGLLDKVLQEEGGASRLPGPHCYAFFSGTDAFLAASETEIDAFYLTDYLARHFETLVWKGFGMADHPELRDMLFAHYTKVVYLAQTDDPKLDTLAAEAADKLQLPLERRPTGYGDLTEALVAVNAAG